MSNLPSKSYSPEPPRTWERVDFNPDFDPGSLKSHRERAEIESTRDLAKPIEQLLCDFHDNTELAEKQPRDPESYLRYMLHGQKRMVGMMARVALSNANTQWWLSLFTILMVIMAAIQSIAALVFLFKS